MTQTDERQSTAPAFIGRIDDDWWRDAVIYQIYPRSFADGNGDGVGDLSGALERLDHVHDLGADAVWLSPFFVSPQADAGYDVADYCDVDPLFGTLADFDALMLRAHNLGLRVIIDLVPNHTSIEHPWFKAAQRPAVSDTARDRYIIRPGRGPIGELPPNDWTSVFHGPAWSRFDTDGAWYLHLFDPSQPDLNWHNADVLNEFDDILRFWLDRGVDGFRIDVAHGLIKQEGLPDWGRPSGEIIEGGARGPMWDQEGVHAIYRRWRRVLQEYGDDRILVAEAWVAPASRLSRYVRSDEMHQAFNFDFLTVGWDGTRVRDSVTTAIRENEAVGAAPTWVLSNHDVVRAATRFGAADAISWPPQVHDQASVDAELGSRRARAAAVVMFGLPGSVYLYAGEELGLPDYVDLPETARQDPSFARSGGADLGRDGCRVPLPWEHAAPAYGFNTTGQTWLPQPESYRQLAADQQHADRDSALSLYRTGLRLRSVYELGRGALTWSDQLGILSFRNGDIEVNANYSNRPQRLPNSLTPVLASNPDAVQDGYLMPNSAVWQLWS